MPPHSSSTSSSEPATDGGPVLSAAEETGRRGFVTALVALVGLVAIDVTLNMLLPYPTDPRAGDPGFLKSYFEYGRSVEGTLDRMTGTNEADSDPIVSVGWLDPAHLDQAQARPRDGQRMLVAVYGMSHANLLGQAIERVAPDVGVRHITAPGGAPNWSHAAYQLDRGRHEARAAVFALLSVSIPRLSTLSAMTAYFDRPMPYTQPRYRLRDGALVRTDPPFQTFADYLEAQTDPDRWAEWRELLALEDKYYSPLLFRSGPLDRSALARLLRRGYANGRLRRLDATVHGPAGFDPTSEEIRVLHALLRNFARSARADGVLPAVYVANNLGWNDDLARVVRPVLEAEGIVRVSSHEFASPSDPGNYLPDSHFHAEHDEAFARALVARIDAALAD